MVGAFVGAEVGAVVGAVVGVVVGLVGAVVGEVVGAMVGASVVGESVGELVGGPSAVHACTLEPVVTAATTRVFSTSERPTLPRLKLPGLNEEMRREGR